MMETPSAPASQAIDQNALAEIAGMKPWLRFFSILGFIICGLCLLAGILILAAAAFHRGGHTEVAEIRDAYHLLDDLMGVTFASVLFAVALLASGRVSVEGNRAVISPF